MQSAFPLPSLPSRVGELRRLDDESPDLWEVPFGPEPDRPEELPTGRQQHRRRYDTRRDWMQVSSSPDDLGPLLPTRGSPRSRCCTASPRRGSSLASQATAATAAALLLAAVLGCALLAAVPRPWPAAEGRSFGQQDLEPDSLVGFWGIFGDRPAEAPTAKKCKQGPVQPWVEVKTTGRRSKEAAKQALLLVNAARTRCPSGLTVGPLKLAVKDFESSRTQRLYMEHKFSSSCDLETFRVHFFVGSLATSFAAEVARDLTANTWSLLESTPAPCAVPVAGNAAPLSLPVSSALATNGAKFVASELAYQMKERGCLNKKARLRPGRVLQLISRLVDGVQIDGAFTMQLKLPGKSEQRMFAQLTAIKRCGERAQHKNGDRCIWQLAPLAPSTDICEAMKEPTDPTLRVLAGLEKVPQSLGHVAPDRTELQQRRLAALRALQVSGSPAGRSVVGSRLITSGEVLEEFDPRGSDCFSRIPVADQGSCATCYAQALSHMVGLRRCLALELAGSMENSSSTETSTSTTMTSSAPPPCSDSSQWQDEDGRDCSWFADRDPGCLLLPDNGQRSHCLETCGTCPEVPPHTPVDETFRLMGLVPSVDDIASCVNSADVCSGGNVADTWDQWLVSLQRPLWTEGDHCRPYTLKCSGSTGVVNPLAAKRCSLYDSLKVWERPCSCIPQDVKDAQRSPQCDAAGPGDDCSAPVPLAAFWIISVADGLLPTDAARNMQRHIMEFGPISVAYEVYMGFMQWDWARKPVYTGSGDRTFLGGHAVLAVGWGNWTSPRGVAVDYWLLRNSWGSDWNDRGYFKFQRGVNLDAIEEREVTVVMTSSDFPDFSPPSCTPTSSSLLNRMDKATGVVAGYVLRLKFVCDPDTDTVEVVYSMPQKHTKGGLRLSVKMHPSQEAEVRLNLFQLGFGLHDGEVQIQFQATDFNGNVGSTTTSSSVPKLPGATSLAKS